MPRFTIRPKDFGPTRFTHQIYEGPGGPAELTFPEGGGTMTIRGGAFPDTDLPNRLGAPDRLVVGGTVVEIGPYPGGIRRSRRVIVLTSADGRSWRFRRRRVSAFALERLPGGERVGLVTDTGGTVEPAADPFEHALLVAVRAGFLGDRITAFSW